MDIKYLVFDLDDTLLRRNRKISDYTLKVLNKAHELGLKIVFNTSRSKQNSAQYADIVHPDYGIYNGGCQIVDKDGNDLYTNTINKEDTKRLTKYLSSICPKISVQTKEHFYASDKDYRGQNAIHYDFKDGLEEDCFKILCLNDDLPLIKKIAKENNLELQNYLNGGWNRLSVKGANKWFGLKKLIELLSADKDEFMTFGDDVGDMDMILNSGVGVAMKNSQPQLLKVAKNITLSNEDDGCAVFINKYFDLKIED